MGGDSGGGSVGAESSVWLCVCDTGAGIPPEFHDKIFDEFFQLRQHTARSEGNGGNGGPETAAPRQTMAVQPRHGLGLAICKRLVEAMGGTIRVESEAGKGSRFTVVLPASALVQQ